METPVLWPPDAKNWLIWKKPWCWERLKRGGEGDSRGWDGWMASLTHWTWVWVGSGSWMDREAWHAVVCGVAKSDRHDWVTELNLIFWWASSMAQWVWIHLQCRRCGFDPQVRKIPWSRQPTPVFLPGKSQRQRSLVGYSSRGNRESDVT